MQTISYVLISIKIVESHQSLMPTINGESVGEAVGNAVGF